MTNMNKFKLLCPALIILLCTISVVPAAAFTSDSLEIIVEENGDSIVNFDYSLSWLEKIAVFFKITDPAAELKKGLEGHSSKKVEVLSAEDDSVSFRVFEFTKIRLLDDNTTYTTPAVSFSDAEKVLQDYWFAPLITVDLSPSTTEVKFPDGYNTTFENVIEIASVSHNITK